MRNTDRIQQTLKSEITDLREFRHDGKILTKMEAFEIMLGGNYVHAKDGNGTWHRIFVMGSTEYKEACPDEDEEIPQKVPNGAY